MAPSNKQFVSISDPLFSDSEYDFTEFTSMKGGYHDGRGRLDHDLSAGKANYLLMPLLFVEPHEQVWNTHGADLADFVGSHIPVVQSYHLPVGALCLQQVADGAALADAQPSGCRILCIFSDPLPGLHSTRTSCEMTDPTLYVQARLRSVTYGDLVETTFERIDEARDLPAVRAADFEPHLLSIPGLQFLALHLMSKGQGCDLILPVLSEDSRLPTNGVLEGNAFLAAATANCPRANGASAVRANFLSAPAF